MYVLTSTESTLITRPSLILNEIQTEFFLQVFYVEEMYLLLLSFISLGRHIALIWQSYVKIVSIDIQAIKFCLTIPFPLGCMWKMVWSGQSQPCSPSGVSSNKDKDASKRE